MATPEPTELWLAASSSAQPFAQTLAAAYHQAYPHITVRLLPTANSQAATHQLVVGNADVALLTDPGIQNDSGSFLTDQIAWDPLVLVVHPDNNLETVSMQEIRAIFQGQTREWPRRSRMAGIIQVMSREEGSGLRWAFEDQVMDGQAITSTGLILPGNEELRDAVAQTQQAIGYLPASWLDETVKPLAVDGIQPRAEALRASAYPLRLPIYLLSHGRPSSDTAKLREFALAAAGQAALGENGVSWQQE